MGQRLEAGTSGMLHSQAKGFTVSLGLVLHLLIFYPASVHLVPDK